MGQNQTSGPKAVTSRMQMEDDYIDLLELASVLWSKALYIIVSALLCGVLALGYSVLLVAPKYDSTVTMYVNTGSLSLGSLASSITQSNLTTSEKLVDLYITILQSRETVAEVQSEAGLNYDYEDFSKMISAKSGTASGVFTVTASSRNPNEAELIANTIAKVLPTRISDIVDGTSARVIEYAVVASDRSSPSYTKNVLMGLVIGTVLSCGLFTVKYLVESSRDTVIHSVDELNALYPDIPVLATIMDMRQTSKKGYGYGYYYQKEPEDKADKVKKNAKKGA